MQPEHFPLFRKAITAAIAVAMPVLLAAAGCHSGTPSTLPRSSPTVVATTSAAVPSNAFAGSAACANCHALEFKRQSHSHHALTMRHADRKSLGSLAPPVGEISGTPYSIGAGDDLDSFRFERTGNRDDGAKVEYALGSGASNLTFIGEIGSDRLTEFRMSYNPGRRVWYTTPGQETRTDLKPGTVHLPGVAARCILCHADTSAPGTLRPAETALGVGCESCHGPGAEHIKAAEIHSRSGDLKMSSLIGRTSHETNTLCGRCHRTIDDVSLTGFDPGNTARFQSYAIEISPCYKKSGGKISCITCHDPHVDAVSSARHYEAVCLSCHSASTLKATTSKICPVNAVSGCIGCHMPKRQVLPGTKIPLTMTDHFIWAYPPHH